jgi:hypothetical protein
MCAVCFVVFALQVVPAIQQTENACEDRSYENHNQIDYKPLKLAKIQGTGVIEIRQNVIKHNEIVPGACLTLFTTDHKFIVSTKANSRGAFQFNDIAPGRYSLLARAPAFCTANIPIRVIKASRRSKLQRQRIVVHYRVSEIDTCSWGGIEKIDN